MNESSPDQRSRLPITIAFTAGGFVLAIFATRAFDDVVDEWIPWTNVWARLAFVLLLPSVFALAGWLRGTLATFLLVAMGSALAMAITVAQQKYSELEQFDAFPPSIRVASYAVTILYTFAIGLLLPSAFAIVQLWPSRSKEFESHDWERP